MLPDIGAVELLILGAVALIVVGPKDLPKLMREVGRAVARLRGLADQFRAQFDAMAREAEIDELKDDVRKMRDAADPTRDMKTLARDLKDDIEGAGENVMDPRLARTADDKAHGEETAEIDDALDDPTGGASSAGRKKPLAGPRLLPDEERAELTRERERGGGDENGALEKAGREGGAVPEHVTTEDAGEGRHG